MNFCFSYPYPCHAPRRKSQRAPSPACPPDQTKHGKSSWGILLKGHSRRHSFFPAKKHSGGLPGCAFCPYESSIMDKHLLGPLLIGSEHALFCCNWGPFSCLLNFLSGIFQLLQTYHLILGIVQAQMRAANWCLAGLPNGICTNVCIGNGFIRSETSVNIHGSLNGNGFQFFPGMEYHIGIWKTANSYRGAKAPRYCRAP